MARKKRAKENQVNTQTVTETETGEKEEDFSSYWDATQYLWYMTLCAEIIMPLIV